MKTKSQIAIVGILAMLTPVVSQAKTVYVNTGNFNKTTLGTIKSGDTVRFKSGTYTDYDTMKYLAYKTKQGNVTIDSDGSGQVNFDKTSSSSTKELTFSSSNPQIKHITFRNIKVILNNCSGAHLDNCIVKDAKTGSKTHSLVLIDGGSGSEVRWTTINRNDAAGKAGKLNSGNTLKAWSCTAKGKLIGGYVIQTDKKSSNSVDPYCNNQVVYGSITRSYNGTEDHGIYIHNAKAAKVSNVTISGFSDSASGNSIKIKGAQDVNISNNTFNNSGIIVRQASNWPNSNKNITLASNTINGGDINGYGGSIGNGYSIEKDCFVSGNKVKNGTISFKKEKSAFNGYVKNNTTKGALELDSDINQSGNSRY